MKFGFRIPSLTKRIAARTSIKRIIRHIELWKTYLVERVTLVRPIFIQLD
jgi:hypothetical protein